MPYLGRGPNFGVRTVFHFLASNGDTSVSGADADGKALSFTDGNFIDVYLNGVRLKSGEDYNTGTANTIAGLSALNANDEVNVVVYDTFTVADTVQASTGGTFSGSITTSGKFNATGDTAAGDDASMGHTSAEGLILTGQGSTSDITIKNDADTAVLTVATGTNTVGFWFPKLAAGTGSQTFETNFGNPNFAISSGNADDNGYGNFEYDVPTGYYAICTKNLAEYG